LLVSELSSDADERAATTSNAGIVEPIAAADDGDFGPTNGADDAAAN